MQNCFDLIIDFSMPSPAVECWTMEQQIHWLDQSNLQLHSWNVSNNIYDLTVI